MARRRNWLLGALEPATRARFEPHMRDIKLPRGQVLQRAGDEVAKVYFPEGALIGVISTMPAGEAVQTGMIGWDGALGVFEACGTRQSALQAEVLVEGEAWVMTAEDYRRMYDASEALRVAVHKYVEILLTEARQFVACNALHAVEARLCRTILEALERSCDGSHTLPATQEALAQMLGVQRTTVTAAVSALQAAGALRTARGQVEVLELRVIEQAACPCREALKAARGAIYAADDKTCDA
ncbi:Crp/Fnr family transcriptional regulator [Phenylobacterium sp. LjRoot219]|uniref:Crp/Fnr family transcriptional regulator n=1 Tax=Phenylobacterium sp. LjRoot219 TaxID=3342283 RepID=UPI003ECC5A43